MELPPGAIPTFLECRMFLVTAVISCFNKELYRTFYVGNTQVAAVVDDGDGFKVDVNTSAAPFKLERHSEGHGGI